MLIGSPEQRKARRHSVLGISRKAKLTPEFDLYLVRHKRTLRVSLKWRAGDLAGIAFGNPKAALFNIARNADQQFILDA